MRPWIRDVSQEQLSTAKNASLLKWRGYLQEQAEPTVAGLSNSQEDVASLLLRPLLMGLEELVMVPHCLSLWRPGIAPGRADGTRQEVCVLLRRQRHHHQW